MPPVSVIPKTSMYVCWKNRNVELGKKTEYIVNMLLVVSKKNTYEFNNFRKLVLLIEFFFLHRLALVKQHTLELEQQE